ncbi:ABC-type multidrug transport system fused ATPase/permease subunit [Kineothrix alysoides]|uniref:ABC-type multidrug transport system fused ATPase/permease subunit n=1 Tax=Kineothrix alysoides TaxID=1469948 RepID=A0A4R1R0Z8_9FIRM|nr:ABC transporter ATP-binding protein [Kineothrix alysoides]TCL58993.1 ABC-type multidrug transport system fused ATPase/permease subunit [Kineothrix alysoides]
MKKLLIYLKDYKKETVLAPLFKMLEASFELFVPLVMAAIIDTGIAQGDKRYIVRMCLIMVALGVIGLVCSVTAQYYSAKAAVGFSAGLKHELFKHIQKLSFTEIDEIGTSTLITRMTNDVNQVQSGVNLILRLFLRSPFIVFGVMVMAFTIDIKAAMIFVVTILLLSVVVFGIMWISMPLYKKVQAGLDSILGITRENLTGVRVIRAFNKEAAEIKRFEGENEELARMQQFVGKISALMNPVTYVIINGALIVLIWTGALRVDGGYITQGAVVALVNYMSQILVELIKLANLIITVTKAFASANRITAVFEMKPSLVSPEKENVASWSHGEGNDDIAVSFEHVHLTYKNAGAEALTDIDFKVKKGQTVGIIGGTGSGKSSLINMIPRFYDATGGCVRVNGVDVRDYPLYELRSKIGIVMQKAVLFKGTIRENLRWGRENASEEEMRRALEIAQAKGFVEEKTGGLDARVSQEGKNYSGGQKQRLTIARALVRKPEILILDDSASALDFATDARLRQEIRNMEGNMTVFIVSQRAASIRHADFIIVMEDGEVAGIGTHEQLVNSCSVYKEIYASQFKKEERA